MLELSELVRFDERENPTTSVPTAFILYYRTPITTPAASRMSSWSQTFPPLTSGDTGGWMYMNLHRPAEYGAPSRATQSWVIVSMEAEGRYSTAFTAASLGNGCSPPAASWTTGGRGANPIGPSP
jgi:hypothetical protein